MRAGWPIKTLAEVCQIKPPKAEARRRASDTDLVSFVPMENLGIDEKILVPKQEKPLAEIVGSYTYFADGDVLLAKITPCFENGKLGIAANLTNGIGFGSSEYIVFRPDQSVDKEWLYYFLSRVAFRTEGAERMSGAVGHKRVAKEFIEKYPIPVPPLPEQQRIIGILDEAFDGIATAKANAEKNLQNARALFESHLQSVFTKRGEGWVEKRLGEVCGFVRGPFGGSLKKSIFVADGYAVYEQQHAIYDQFDEIRYFIDEAKFKEMQRFELLPNDLIMSCSGTMGRVAIVPDSIKRGIINQALLKLTPGNRISNVFLKLWMESNAFQTALKEYSGGAAIQNVASVKVLKEIIVSLPSLAEQNRVVDELESLREEIQRLESIYQQKLSALDELKKSLLHQAFSGQL
jgi:type I restriction enzyme S subunit